MKKKLKRIGLILGVVTVIWVGMLIFDRNMLRQELIRLHVVAASDSAEDQQVKLQVRDAILESLREGISEATDVESAIEYVEDSLPKLERAANTVLEKAGFADTVRVSLNFENFPKRVYDTFALPSGIYRSLRVIIGEGEGHNWWCVVFPQLCVPASSEAFACEAEDSGLPEGLTQTLAGNDGYSVRFYALDLLGKVENFLFPQK